MILPPKSESSHHHKVTNITMSPTSLSPNFIVIASSVFVKSTMDGPDSGQDGIVKKNQNYN